MNYQVEWSDLAEQLLAAIWLAAPDRNAITTATNAIDRALASSPNTVGVPGFDTVREHQHPPLGVEFEVVDADRRVFVLTCWDTSSGRPTPTGN